MHCRLDEWNAVYEMVILGRDLNGFVGRERDGYEGVHGGFGFGIRNVCVRGVGGGGGHRERQKKLGVWRCNGYDCVWIVEHVLSCIHRVDQLPCTVYYT